MDTTEFASIMWRECPWYLKCLYVIVAPLLSVYDTICGTIAHLRMIQIYAALRNGLFGYSSDLAVYSGQRIKTGQSSFHRVFSKWLSLNSGKTGLVTRGVSGNRYISITTSGQISIATHHCFWIFTQFTEISESYSEKTLNVLSKMFTNKLNVCD